MQVIIMRGVAGSGKSTWINENYPDAVVCSADHYHMTAEGKYDFKPQNIGEAHKRCMRTFADMVSNLTARQSNTTVIVDNTNTKAHEIAPYLRLAEAYGISWRIVRCHCCSPEKAICRGTHNVPASTVLQMYANIMTEQLPGWKEEIVLTS